MWWGPIAIRTVAISVLIVCTEEIGKLTDGFPQHAHARQIDYAEVVRLLPIERTTMADQDMLVMQQIKGELLIRMNVELLHIDLWEDIERGLGLDCRNARNLIEHVVDEIALIMDRPPGTR